MHTLRPLFNLIMAASLMLSGTHAGALQVKVKQDVNLRVNQLGYMKRVGVLKSGSVVDIPDRYVVLNSAQKPDLELTLMNWLRKGSELASSESLPSSSQIEDRRYEYYFPVKVASVVRGSKVPKDQEVYVALAHLSKKKRLQVVSDAPVYARINTLLAMSQPAVATTNNDNLDPNLNDRSLQGAGASTEAGIQLTCSNCEASNPVADVLRVLPKTFTRLAEMFGNITDNVEGNRIQSIAKFERTCNGSTKSKTWGEFRQILQDKLGQDTFLLSYIENKMLIEGSSDCFGSRHENNGSYSLGLFQVNNKSSNFKMCSTAEVAAIKAATFAQLKNGPRCLSNPLVNLDESLRLLKEKEAALFAPGKFEKDKMTTEDRYRFLTSAYNAGEKYALRARQNLLEFVRHQQALGKQVTYNPNSWDDVKPFYFRNFLNENEQRQLFGQYKLDRKRQSYENAVRSIAHSEVLVQETIQSLGPTVAATTLPQETTI